jgi:hypothetical protein
MKNTEAKIGEQLIQLIQTRVSIEELQQHIDKINSNFIFSNIFTCIHFMSLMSIFNFKNSINKKIEA